MVFFTDTVFNKFYLIEYFFINPCCKKVNTIVIGKKPNTLNVTQKSVEKFLQITSFKIAIAIKKNPHLRVNIFHPISSNFSKLER